MALRTFALQELPRAGGFRHLHRGWQESLLTIALPLVVVSLVPGRSFAAVGVTSGLTPGWFRPSIGALVIAAGVPLVFFALGSRVSLTGEGWAYLAVMPGLAEELLFRGLYQSLLNRALGRKWRVGGAEAPPVNAPRRAR